MNDNAAVKRQLADVARMVHLSAYTDILAGNTSAGLFIVDELIADLQRRVAALESNVQKMHGVQNGSGDIAETAPTALFDGEACVLKDGLLLVTPAGMVNLRGKQRVRIVVYGESEARS